MRGGAPPTVLASVTRRRFVATAWPWRALGYVLTSLPVAVAAMLPMLALGLPWLVPLTQAVAGRSGQPLGVLVVVAAGGVVMFLIVGPMVAMPLATVERRRLRMVDSRPVTSGHRRPPEVGLWPWLRTRYAEQATWRELAYACALAVLAPAWYGIGLTLLLLIGTMIASPLLVSGGQASVSLGFGKVSTAGQAVPYALAGLALLPAVPYLLALLAGAHGALARALLHVPDQAGLREELVEVSRSRARLLDAFDAERRRIERDLHDGAQRRLVGLALQLGLARLDLPPGSAAEKAVADAHEQAKHVMTELRNLVRGIHPQILTDLGLPAALDELADEAMLPVSLSVRLGGRLPPQVEAAGYFVAAEALTNAVKHSGAARVSISASHDGDRLVLEISDDGCGGADPVRGTGLTGLADRVAAVGGRMLLSSPVGGPTRVRVEIPCDRSE